MLTELDTDEKADRAAIKIVDLVAQDSLRPTNHKSGAQHEAGRTAVFNQDSRKPVISESTLAQT